MMETNRFRHVVFAMLFLIPAGTYLGSQSPSFEDSGKYFERAIEGSVSDAEWNKVGRNWNELQSVVMSFGGDKVVNLYNAVKEGFSIAKGKVASALSDRSPDDENPVTAVDRGKQAYNSAFKDQLSLPARLSKAIAAQPVANAALQSDVAKILSSNKLAINAEVTRLIGAAPSPFESKANADAYAAWEKKTDELRLSLATEQAKSLHATEMAMVDWIKAQGSASVRAREEKEWARLKAMERSGTPPGSMEASWAEYYDKFSQDTSYQDKEHLDYAFNWVYLQEARKLDEKRAVAAALQAQQDAEESQRIMNSISAGIQVAAAVGGVALDVYRVSQGMAPSGGSVGTGGSSGSGGELCATGQQLIRAIGSPPSGLDEVGHHRHVLKALRAVKAHVLGCVQCRTAGGSYGMQSIDRSIANEEQALAQFGARE